jgi:hypothetical protein
MNCRIAVNLNTLEVEKSHELVEVFDVKIENNILYLEVSKPEPELDYFYQNVDIEV